MKLNEHSNSNLQRSTLKKRSDRANSDYSGIVCVGAEINIDGCLIDNLYISSAGDIVVCSAKNTERNSIAKIAKYVKKIDCEKLDDICAEYTLKKFNQAYKIIDLMAARGYLTYSDESKFTNAVNKNLSNADFLLTSNPLPIQDSIDFFF